MEQTGGKGLKTDAKKRKKKAIIIVFAAMALFALLWFLFFRNIDWNGASSKTAAFLKDDDTATRFLFRRADYDENIFDDEVYMELDRNMRYEYAGVTYTITDENYARFGPDVEFFGEYFACAISGDVAGYNALFSELYYKDNEPKEAFTMQKIYDMQVSKLQEEKDADGVTTYLYKVDYKIRLNNGTLRDDMGEDGSRPLLFVLTDREGKIKADRVIPYSYYDPTLG